MHPAVLIGLTTFACPLVDRAQCLENIHTPELFRKIPGLGFDIVTADRPRPVGRYSAVDFEFRTCLGPGRARLFTDARNESNLYLMDRLGAPGLFVHCLVDRKKLRVGYEFLREPRPVEVGLIRFILDPARIAGYTGGHAEVPALRAYRRGVLYGVYD